MGRSSANGDASEAGARGASASGVSVAPDYAAKPEQSAEYIADLTSELAKIARISKLDMIAYLLDIVRLEAETTLQRLNQKTA